MRAALRAAPLLALTALAACLAAPPAYAPGTPGIVGLALGAAPGGRIVVASVHPRTPAARADVRVGDEVVAIDGASARALGLIGASNRLAGAPGSHLRLFLRRAGRRRPFTVRLRRAPPSPPPARRGIDIIPDRRPAR
ncbi:MAG: PDZ domain-containing protein [Elusimicrobia bacterium]|nr:PDZ domain-containing protein [Elusimicrobiota bacterium]